MANDIPKWEDTEAFEEEQKEDETPKWEDTEAFEEEQPMEPIPIPGRGVARGEVTDLTPEQLAAGEKMEAEAREAFVKQAAPAATFGLSDVVAGAAGAAGQAVGELQAGRVPELEQLKETYYEAKAGEQARREELMGEYPAASIAGLAAGAITGPSAIGTGLRGVAKVAPRVAKVAGRVLPSTEGLRKTKRLEQLADIAKSQNKIKLFNQLKKAQKVQALKTATVEGAKAGTLYGTATGPARLLEGDIEGTVKEAVKGAGIGGALGGGMTAGGMMAGGLIKRIPGVKNAMDSFVYGTRGYDIEDEQVASSIVDAAKKWNKNFQDKLDDLGISQREALGMLDDAGITINTRDDILAAKTAIENIKSPTYRQKANEFLNILDDYLETGAESRKALTRIQDKLRKRLIKTPLDEAKAKGERKALKSAIEKKETPITKFQEVDAEDVITPETPGIKATTREVATPTGQIDAQGNPIYKTKTIAETFTEPTPTQIETIVDPTTGKEIFKYKDLGTGKVEMAIGGKPITVDTTQLSPSDAKNLQKLVNRYSKLAGSEAMPEEATAAATKLAKNIGKKIEKVAEKTQLKSINTKISKLLENKEFMKTVPKVAGSRRLLTDLEEQSMAEFIAGTSDNKILANKDLVLKRIRSVDPELAREFNKELNTLRELYKLSGSKVFTPDSTNILRAMAGGVGTIANRVANAAGRVVKAVKDSPQMLAKQHSGFIQSSPEYVKNLALKIKKTGETAYQKYIGPLMEAAASKPVTKNAILHGLFQKPEFREMIRSVEENKPKEDQEEMVEEVSE